MIGILMAMIGGAMIFADSCKTQWASDDARIQSKRRGDLWYIDRKCCKRLVHNNHLCTTMTYYSTSAYMMERVLPVFPDAKDGDRILIDSEDQIAVYNFTSATRASDAAEKIAKERYLKAKEEERRRNWVCPEPTVEECGTFDGDGYEKDPNGFKLLGYKGYHYELNDILPHYFNGRKFRDIKTGEIYLRIKFLCSGIIKGCDYWSYYCDTQLNFIRLSDEMVMNFDAMKYEELMLSFAQNNLEEKKRMLFEYKHGNVKSILMSW